MTSTTRNDRRHAQGLVTSTRMAATITVLVEQAYRHPKYGKYVRRRRKLLAHDPAGDAREGDLVEIASTRPISKRKRWRLVRVVRRSELGLDRSHERGGEA